MGSFVLAKSTVRTIQGDNRSTLLQVQAIQGSLTHPLHAYLLRFVSSLTQVGWQALIPALRSCYLARGAHFVQAGEHRPERALLLSGSCRLYYLRSGGEECTTYFFL